MKKMMISIVMVLACCFPAHAQWDNEALEIVQDFKDAHFLFKKGEISVEQLRYVIGRLQERALQNFYQHNKDRIMENPNTKHFLLPAFPDKNDFSIYDRLLKGNLPDSN